MRTRLLGAGLAIAAVALCVTLPSPLAAQRSRESDGPLFGLQPFPYDFTAEALDKVHELAEANGTLAIVHRDNGIPWAEALKDAPFPASVENEWNDLARRIPEGRPVYLALGVVAEDRVSLAKASEGSSLPFSIRFGNFDSPSVKTAYLNFARRAVARFRPKFLNLGVEAGEIAARAPKKWPAFVALYDHVRTQLKRENPELLIGISFGLESLRTDEVAARAKGLVESSDYLGLSFYPYMSPFHEKFGAKPLTAPPGQWRDALAWAAKYTSKPLAIAETGYSTRDVNLPAFKLQMRGSPALQEQYVRDLGEIARRNRYLFVVWSISVDYEALYKKLPAGDGRYLLWQNVGLFDSQLKPRPAWSEWQQIVGAPRSTGERNTSTSAAVDRRPAAPRRAGALGFDTAQDLFLAPAPDRVTLDRDNGYQGAAAMRWSYSYERGRWQWLTKELRAGDLRGRSQVQFAVRSDRAGQLFLQLEEQSGETFFAMIDAGPEWVRVTRAVSGLAPDPSKRKDGRLDMAQVIRILVADSAGALSSARGTRAIWLSDWSFE